MAQAAALGPQLVFGSIDAERVGGMRWLSPTLVGFTLPLVVAMIAFPVLATEGRMVIEILLMVLLLLSIAAYAVSVLMPGALVGFVINKGARTVTLVREGPFANTTTTLAFTDIAGLRATTRYDDDGYGVAVTELVTRAGETVELPLALTPAEVDAGRTALGLAQKGR